MQKKSRIAIYWAASCGGCEIAFVNLHEKLFDVAEHFELVFCPALVDTKTKDVQGLPDKVLDVTLFNGAIRTSENEEMAHLMRRKSKVLVAYGACASLGGIPALSNLHRKSDHFRAAFVDNLTVDNPQAVCPRTETVMPEGVLRLPEFYARVKTLSEVVDVDYVLPGCPPEPHQIWNVVEALIKGSALPPKGSVLGAGRSNVCAECERKRHEDRKLGALRRTYEIIPDVENCLLEQGLLCMGIATRDGCGALCPKVNAPCLGCYGPPEGVRDQAGSMASALGGLLDIEPLKQLPEEKIPEHVDEGLKALPDCAGTFLKFSVAGSALQARRDAR